MKNRSQKLTGSLQGKFYDDQNFYDEIIANIICGTTYHANNYIGKKMLKIISAADLMFNHTAMPHKAESHNCVSL